MENPIDKQRREYLAGAEKRAAETVGLLEKCRKCGVDISAEEQALLEMVEQITAIKEEFVGVKPDKEIDKRA